MSKFLDEGAYGCVYHPGVQCNGKKLPTKYISKIQKKQDRTEYEPQIGKKLKAAIPYYERYFAPAIDACPVNLSSIKQKERSKCNVLTKHNANNANNANNTNNPTKEAFVSMKIQYVGKHTLGDNFRNHAEKSPSTFYEHLRDAYMYLANAIEELRSQQIVHFDLKENNVMYSDKLHVPIIIDFGMSFQVSSLYSEETLKKIFFTSYEKYPPWCPDIMCIASIVNTPQWEKKKVRTNSLKLIIKTYFQHNPIIKLIRSQPYQEPLLKKQETQWLQYVEHLEQKKGKTALKELLSRWNEWDMYSLNVMFLGFLHQYNMLDRDPQFTQELGRGTSRGTYGSP